MTKFGEQVQPERMWVGGKIGTCGDPVDLFRVGLSRTRAIPDILVGFDGERNGWVICGSFYTPDGTDFEPREVGFIPEATLDEWKFSRTVGARCWSCGLPALRQAGSLLRHECMECGVVQLVRHQEQEVGEEINVP